MVFLFKQINHRADRRDVCISARGDSALTDEAGKDTVGDLEHRRIKLSVHSGSSDTERFRSNSSDCADLIPTQN